MEFDICVKTDKSHSCHLNQLQVSKMNRFKTLLVSAWQNITIEPVVFFYLTSVGLVSVIRPNLLLDKACNVKLNYTKEICSNLTGDYLIEAQKVVSDYER